MGGSLYSVDRATVLPEPGMQEQCAFTVSPGLKLPNSLSHAQAQTAYSIGYKGFELNCARQPAALLAMSPAISSSAAPLVTADRPERVSHNSTASGGTPAAQADSAAKGFVPVLAIGTLCLAPTELR